MIVKVTNITKEKSKRSKSKTETRRNINHLILLLLCQDIEDIFPFAGKSFIYILSILIMWI